MSVYNRKMFKRNARNALNQSAGIPSVQRFQVGGQVRGNNAGIGALPMFNTAAFNSFAKQPFSLRNLLGPEGRRLLDASRTPVSQAAAPNVSGIATNLDGSRPIPDPLVGVQPGIPDPLYSGIPASGVTGTATNLDGSRAIPDPLFPRATAPRQSPSEQTQASDRRLIDKARQIGAAQEAGAFDFSEFYDDQGQLRGQPSGSIPDPDYDPTAGSGVTGTATGIDGDRTIPDPEAGVKDSGVRTGVVAEGEDPSLSQQTDPGGAAATAAAETVEKMDPETATLAEGKGAADFVTNLIKDFQDNDDPDAAADTALAALGQIDPADAGKLSTDERLAKMKETISKFFGRDLEQEKRVDGLNMAMLGFLIAAGDSPNALKNIAKGSVQGLKEIKKTKEARMAREDKINGLVVSTVLGREDKESDQNFRRELLDVSNKHDLYKFSTSRVDKMKLAAADLSFKGYALDQSNALKLALQDKQIDMLNARMQNDMNMLIQRLESNEAVAAAGVTSREEIARLGRESAESIAAAGNAAQFDRSVIANLPDGYSLAMLEAKNQGLEGEALIDYTVANGKKFAAEASLTGPDSLKRAVITMVPDIMKADQSSFAEASQELYNNPEFQRLYSDQMEKAGIKLVEVTNLEGVKIPGKFVPGSIFDENGSLIGRVPGRDNRGQQIPYYVITEEGGLRLEDPDDALKKKK